MLPGWPRTRRTPRPRAGSGITLQGLQQGDASPPAAASADSPNSSAGAEAARFTPACAARTWCTSFAHLHGAHKQAVRLHQAGPGRGPMSIERSQPRQPSVEAQRITRRPMPTLRRRGCVSDAHLLLRARFLRSAEAPCCSRTPRQACRRAHAPRPAPCAREPGWPCGTVLQRRRGAGCDALSYAAADRHFWTETRHFLFSHFSAFAIRQTTLRRHFRCAPRSCSCGQISRE